MKFFKSKITMALLIIIVMVLTWAVVGNLTKENLHSVGSYRKLQQLNDDGEEDKATIISYALLFPWNLLSEMDLLDIDYGTSYSSGSSYVYDGWYGGQSSITSTSSSSSGLSLNTTTDTGSELVAGEDYSTTNVQVEEVDEADIIKTDGEYVYSLSDYDVVITDVRDEENPVIVSTIDSTSSTIVPQEMMLYDDKLVLISIDTSNSYKKSTQVEVYNLADKANPQREKVFYLKQTYYTSRIVGDNFYLICSGYLREDSDGNTIDYYSEDNVTKSIGYRNMYYFKDKPSDFETLICSYNLKEEDSKFNVKAYLMDVDNIYVSENNIYLEDERYGQEKNLGYYIKKMFGMSGIYGLLDDDSQVDDNDYYANIFKFTIKDDGTVKYSARTRERGEAVDQFSFDEYDSNLRVALQDDSGSRIVIFNDKLKKIGETESVEEDEDMYSSRFVGERAYLVTYRTVDPLFVFDLSDATEPKLMGELNISGYSTYLHPYDETHLIGIGMQTEEVIKRNSDGEVTSTISKITGMKMALFDVSDISNPEVISEVEIGDKYTRSAVLTNHKALLFSKSKELIAIPVTSYTDEIDTGTVYTDTTIDSLISKYTNALDSTYISEGYLVYKINTEDGITLRGIITHNIDSTSKTYNYSGSMLRGIYIKDSLITVSQHLLKVNNLDTLEEISSIEI